MTVPGAITSAEAIAAFGEAIRDEAQHFLLAFA